MEDGEAREWRECLGLLGDQSVRVGIGVGVGELRDLEVRGLFFRYLLEVIECRACDWISWYAGSVRVLYVGIVFHLH